MTLHASWSSDDDATAEATRLIAAVDNAYAQADADAARRDAASSFDAADSSASERPATWRTLWDTWQTALAPYASRVLLTWVPAPAPGAADPRVPLWPNPRAAAAGWVIVAVQPRGWTARDRARWVRRLAHFMMSRPPAPLPAWVDGLLPGVRSPWVWVLGVAPDPTAAGGWAWADRRAFPTCRPHQSALDATPLVTATVHALQAAEQHPVPLAVPDRWRHAPASRLQPTASQALEVGGGVALAVCGVHGFGVAAFLIGMGAGLAYDALRHWRWRRWIATHTT